MHFRAVSGPFDDGLSLNQRVRVMIDRQLLDKWIAHVFDHPVEEEAWYFDYPIVCWENRPEEIAQLIAETFERSEELLARFSDAQLGQGLSFLVSNLWCEYMITLNNLSVPLELRCRALWSFVPLFEQVMAKRCSPQLTHINQSAADPLNAVCFCWWDNLPIYGEPDVAACREFDQEVLKVLRRLLTIEHDACRESALYGCDEWAYIYPSEILEIVEEFLARTPGLCPELVKYANLVIRR